MHTSCAAAKKSIIAVQSLGPFRHPCLHRLLFSCSPLTQQHPSFCSAAAVLVVSAAALLLLLYSLGSYTSTHHDQTLSGRMRNAITAGGGLGQQLQDELSRGAAGQLQQHILALSNISSLSTAQLPLLLQGTNLSSITTADVLDSAAAKGLGWQQHWQLVQLHQQLLCT